MYHRPPLLEEHFAQTLSGKIRILRYSQLSYIYIYHYRYHYVYIYISLYRSLYLYIYIIMYIYISLYRSLDISFYIYIYTLCFNINIHELISYYNDI